MVTSGTIQGVPDSTDHLLMEQDALSVFLARSPDATLIVEPRRGAAPWVILACNAAAGRLYGYAPDELIGQPVALLYATTGETPTSAALARALAGDGPRVAAVHHRKDGTRVEVDLSLTPLVQAEHDVVVAVVRDVTAHRRTERQLAAQQAISRALAGAGHFMDVAAQLLQIIGEQLDWTVGALWCVQGDTNVLRCTATWQAATGAADGFVAANQAISFARGVGLPGAVWASGEPQWMTDIHTAPNFTRHAIAADAGLQSAFAFPIVGPRSGIFGVMEFFSRDTRTPDEDLLGMVAAIGSAAGEYIDRRRAETALRESEARKGAILQSALDAIVTIDHEGRITEFNPAAEAIFGYREADVLGREMAKMIIPPAFRERHRQGLARYLTTGEGPIIGRRIELVALRADGSQFPLELTIARIPTNGPPTFTGFLRDISERKRAEERQQFLTEASTLLAASLDYATTLANLAHLTVPRIADWCSINLLDADGTLARVAARHVDPAKEATLDELRKRHPPDRTRPVLAPDALPLDTAALVREVSDVHLRRFAQNEEQLQIYRAMGFRSAMLVPLGLAERRLGVIILATGESGRRYDADDLALAEALGQRAALAIENARLYQEAQTAVQVRDAFLSIAAHELKTPITSILGYAQLLERRAAQSADARNRRAAEVLVEQSERLTRLVGSLLEVSRIETGQFTLDRQELDLCALARRVADEFRLALPPGGAHTISCSCPEEVVIVEGDGLRLEQVLHNLLQNAVKYSPEGGSIRVRVERQDGQASIAIGDQGIGIPPEAQANLFQRFFRADNVRGRSMSGMGIGLYVVNEIVSRHGGTIAVESAEGKGSTFTIRLPLYEP